MDFAIKIINVNCSEKTIGYKTKKELFEALKFYRKQGFVKFSQGYYYNKNLNSRLMTSIHYNL
jgi:hypothetical protein